MSRQSIRSLSPPEHEYIVESSYSLNRSGHYFLLFVVLAVILWIIFYVWKPTFFQKTGPAGNPTGEANGGKILLWALGVSLILTLIIWLIRR